MYCGSWVLASKSRGPMESVVDGKTGYLSENKEPEKWALKIKEMIQYENNFDKNNGMNSTELKEILKKHAEDNFPSNGKHTDLYSEVQKMFKDKKLKGD